MTSINARIADAEAEARRQSDWDALAPWRDETGWLDIDALELEAGAGRAPADLTPIRHRPTDRELTDQAVAALQASRRRRREDDEADEERRMGILIAALAAALIAIFIAAAVAGA